MATSSPHKNSLSFLIYSIYAAALWCLYYGFTQVLNMTITFVMIDPALEKSRFWRLPFNLNFGESATLLLVGGVLFFIARFLEKKAFDQKMIELTSGPRIWILRLILLAAGLSVTYDFYYLVSHYLGGRGEPVDLLHALVMFGVGSLIIFFAAFNLSGRFHPESSLLNPRSLGFLSLTFVAVIFSIYMAPPHVMKQLREDARQLDQLSALVQRIQNFYSKYIVLPTSLNDLLEVGFDKEKALDIVTKTPYDYKVIGKTSFEVCATFRRDSKDRFLLNSTFYEYRHFELRNFHYKAGRNCHKINIGLDSRPNYSD